MEQDEMHKKMSKFLMKGINLETTIQKNGFEVREKTKNSIPTELLDARLNLLSIASHLLECRSGEEGKTNEEISNKLLLIVTFLQGTSYIESLIAEGQYIKACAAIKQDYELLARIGNIKNDEDVYGETPNIKNLPEEVRRFYGELNDVAHIAKSDILDNIIFKNIEGDAIGISPYSQFNEEIGCNLYELHIYILLNIVKEQILLINEMYEDVEDELTKALKYFNVVANLLEEAGFSINKFKNGS